MGSEALEAIFETLLYGSGKWFGLVILIGMILLIVYTWKITGLIFFPVLLFLGVQYWERALTDNEFYWFALICWISCLLVMWEIYEGLKK